jgi:hypothetical protein
MRRVGLQLALAVLSSSSPVEPHFLSRREETKHPSALTMNCHSLKRMLHSFRVRHRKPVIRGHLLRILEVSSDLRRKGLLSS